MRRLCESDPLSDHVTGQGEADQLQAARHQSGATDSKSTMGTRVYKIVLDQLAGGGNLSEGQSVRTVRNQIIYGDAGSIRGYLLECGARNCKQNVFNFI